jgi:hypothetical protein
MPDPADADDPQDPTHLREAVEEELQELVDDASAEEVERMAERDRGGVDQPNDEVNESAERGA